MTAAAGATNGFQGDLIPVVVPYLASGKWLMADLTHGLSKPWTHGYLRSPEAVPATDFEKIERTGKMPFVVSADLAHGPSNWELVYGNL